ncbi:uncharacterized protein SCHCODRAFT_02241256 [Schizophyllum commune H4-8]|uniref:uncharacterized protein n=1 Tax=Schizophyllum commune (strain H4-8 / FGSC 9210) TaxID=578458 RepID=UPI00215E03D4|nr:uncharacterized protein SCHCODRAFT_02241256 [Schizophyllum commune H4-8]KAI5895854.1 hypothetical protein SCHCODRAFT_02241256 [Schizophyllum commune H4-8]
MGRWGLGGGGVGGKEYPDDRGPELFGEVVGHQGEDVAVLCESVRLVDSYKGRALVFELTLTLELLLRICIVCVPCTTPRRARLLAQRYWGLCSSATDRPPQHRMYCSDRYYAFRRGH